MRRTYLGIGVLAILVLALLAWGLAQQRAAASSLSQSEIAAKAIAYANSVGLQGTPTSVVSKQMTLDEYSARLDPFGNYAGRENTLVWLVVMKGNVAARNAPDSKGNVTFTGYDNIWVLLSTQGEIMGWGAQAPGYELDLNAPPQRITKYPAPSNPNK